MKKITLLIVFVFAFQITFAQIVEISPEKEALFQQYLGTVAEGKAFYANSIKPCQDKKKREYHNSPEWKVLDSKLKELFVIRDEINNRAGKLWGEYYNTPSCKRPYKFPEFNNRSDIDKYLKALTDDYSKYPSSEENGNERKMMIGKCIYEITQELNTNGNKYIGQGTAKPQTSPNLEAEFLAEIAKINSDITEINRLANNRQIMASFDKAQKLCNKLGRYQGDQYFSRTLKKIRKENPGFSFSILPLSEQVTREYWIKMRNRANIAYRNAIEALKGCEENEKLQTNTEYLIAFRLVKTPIDLIMSSSGLFNKKIFGTMQDIYSGVMNKAQALTVVRGVADDFVSANESAFDIKSYLGIVGGLISAYDNYMKVYDMVLENRVQKNLLLLNRQTAQQLIKSNRELLQQFDKYRALIDYHTSSIDCLRDKLMRINLDNESIKGDKITIWGTGLYDWDVDKYINQIKEAGEDLKNEYIYCEDFIKALQIAINQGNTNFILLEEKIRNSGADQTQISAQLSHNRDNADWFEGETTRLLELYTQYCEDENNTYPEDVIIVSNQVIPGVEDQNIDSNDPPVWEYEDEEDYESIYEPENNEPEHNNTNNTTGGISGNGIISTGNGWSAQKIENNPAAIQNDINNAINSGKTPAGIYISDGSEVVVYYIEGNPLGMTAWNLENYNDATSLQNGITSNIEQGLFPMGISFTNQGNLHVLYIKSEISATAWQLVESPLDLDVVSTNMQPWLNQQYVPVGITVYSGMYYTLMTKIPDTKITNWTIEGYQDNNNEILQNVNAKINSGMLPFGYLKEEGIVNILYVGF